MNLLKMFKRKEKDPAPELKILVGGVEVFGEEKLRILKIVGRNGDLHIHGGTFNGHRFESLDVIKRR